MLGRHHPTIRRIRALRREASLRRGEQVFVAEGVHLAQEALASRAEIELVVTSASLAVRPEGAALLSRIRGSQFPHEEVTDAVMDGLQDARTPQPIVMIIRRSQTSLESCMTADGAPLVIVAHALQDPGNLGALVRTADAAGASGLIATGDSVDLFHPRSVRASMGSILRLPAMEAELENTLEQLGASKIRSVAADPSAETVHTAQDLTAPTAIFLGRESAGLPRDLLQRMNLRLRIPIRSGVDSLSVAAAGAVLLFEASRQRGQLD